MKTKTSVFTLVVLLSFSRFVLGESRSQFKLQLKSTLNVSALTTTELTQHFLNRFLTGPHSVYERFDDIAKNDNGDIVRSLAVENIAERVAGMLYDVQEVPPGVEAKIAANYPYSNYTQQQIYTLINGAPEEQKGQLRATVLDHWRKAFLVRAIFRPFRQQLFDFWFNHFNVVHDKTLLDLGAYFQTIQNGLFGNFGDFLLSVAQSPAMLLYLDNVRNIKPMVVGQVTLGPNENYARELLELHTFGMGPAPSPSSFPYTQTDIQQVALILTGWSVTGTQGGTVPRSFTFYQGKHDTSTKMVRGIQYPTAVDRSGELEGKDLIRHLSIQPRTATFISEKLIQKYLSYRVGDFAALQVRMRDKFLEGMDDPSQLRKVYTVLFNSPEFWSQQAYLSKSKRALEFVISTLRMTGIDQGTVNDTVVSAAITQLNNRGQSLFSCAPPTGYPEKFDDWVNTSSVIQNIKYAFSTADLNTSIDSLRDAYLWHEWYYRYSGYYTPQLANMYFDLAPTAARYRLNAGTLVNLPYVGYYPDLVDGVPRPIRTYLGALLGSQDNGKY